MGEALIEELERLQMEADALQRRLVELEILSNEYSRAISTLEFFQSADKFESLMNIGGGVFAYMDVKNSKKVLVDVGAKIVVEKDVSEAVVFLKKKLDEIEEAKKSVTLALREVIARAASIQKELREKDVQSSEREAAAAKK